MYTCVCMCVSVYKHVCVYLCVSVCMNMYMWLHMTCLWKTEMNVGNFPGSLPILSFETWSTEPSAYMPATLASQGSTCLYSLPSWSRVPGIYSHTWVLLLLLLLYHMGSGDPNSGDHALPNEPSSPSPVFCYCC